MAVTDSSDLSPEVVSSLLEEVLSPANAGNATIHLKRLLKEPAVLPVLCQSLTSNTRPQIRQLSAVLLRQCAPKVFGRLAPEVQTVLKEQLLRQLTEETESVVRNAIAHLVVAVAKVEFKSWQKKLLPLLSQLCTSNDAGHREAALLALSGLFENVAGDVRLDFGKFIDIFATALGDPTSARVRQTALKGIPNLLLLAESTSDYQSVRKLVAPMTEAVREAVQRHDEDTVSAAMEVFDDLVECSNVFSGEEISTLCKFMLVIAENKDLCVGVREQALNFIHWVARKKPKLLIKFNVIVDVLRVVVPMGAEPSPFNDDDLRNSGELSPHAVATQMIDSLAIFLPSERVYYPVVSALHPYTQSQNPLEKRAALVLLGVMSEGCEDVMRRKLPELLPFVLSSLVSDNEVIVRAAAICFGQMAEYLQPEISKSSEQSIRCLLSAVLSPNEFVKESVCNAMELLFEHLSSERITPVLGQLLPMMVDMLSSTSKPSVRESCLGVVAAACDAAKEHFEPFLPQMFSILDQAFQQQHPGLCASAVLCAGSIAQSVSQTSFAPYSQRVTSVIMSIMERLSNQNVEATSKSDKIAQSEIRNACYRYFGCLGFAMKADFASLLPTVAPWLLATLTARDGVETEYDDTGDLLSISDDENNDRNIRSVSIRTGFVEEQESALDCMRMLFENIPGAFVYPIVEKTLDAMEVLHQFFHSGIRELVPGILQAILIGVHNANPPSWHKPAATQSEHQSFESLRGWLPGMPCTTLLSPNTKRLWVERIWPIFRAMLTEDDDKEVVGETCRSLGLLIETLGPHLLDELMETHEHPQVALWVVTQVLLGKHVCQGDNEYEAGIDDDEDSRALEELLFDGVSVLVGAVAQALGDQFEHLFNTLHPKVLQLATHRKSCAYRSIGLGCYADVLKNMGATASRFVEPLILPCLEAVTQDVDFNLKRNACFCLGIVVQTAPNHAVVRSKLMDILQALHAASSMDTTDLSDDEMACVNNASSALCRLMMALPHEIVPLDRLVPSVLQTLPIKNDLEETETVVRFLVFLLTTTNLRGVTEANLVEILRVAILVLSDKKALDSVKEGVRQLLHGNVQDTLARLGEGHEVVRRLCLLECISGNNLARDIVNLALHVVG